MSSIDMQNVDQSELENSSVNKVLPMKAQGPKFESLEPTQSQCGSIHL